MKTIFPLLLLVFLCNCHSENNKSHATIETNSTKKSYDSISSLNKDTFLDTLSAQDYRKRDIEKYKKKIITNEDQDSYTMLNITMDNEGDYIIIQPYAFLMAEKYKNRLAYKTFYINSIKILNNGEYKDEYFFNLDIETRRFLKHYIIEGAKLNNPICKNILVNLEKIAKERQIEF